MTFEIVFVLLSLLGMMAALIADKMRPGMVLFSVVVLFLCVGILTPKEMLEGFSNKGMIIGKASGYQVPDSPFLCDYPWRYLYADRYFYQSGSAWYDSGSRL